MKYYYKIIQRTTEEVVVNSQTASINDINGYGNAEIAQKIGEAAKSISGYNTNQYYVQVYSVPETIVEEDMLEGHMYPGHETWED